MPQKNDRHTDIIQFINDIQIKLDKIRLFSAITIRWPQN